MCRVALRCPGRALNAVAGLRLAATFLVNTGADVADFPIVFARMGGWRVAYRWRAVGPGMPLASTRGGRFILAMAPRSAAKPHESPDQLVVYRVP